ncbi:MAG: hypothetical protein JNL98_01175 [Bryobacterales bacterium]|nr:hypothetical protein [Bryobacterales bacterium]
MDLTKAIRELQHEKRRIEQVIAHLETLVSREGGPKPVAGPKKRGRKGMSIEERGDMSRRMKEYWAKRRKEESGSEAEAAQEAPAAQEDVGPDSAASAEPEATS